MLGADIIRDIERSSKSFIGLDRLNGRIKKFGIRRLKCFVKTSFHSFRYSADLEINLIAWITKHCHAISFLFLYIMYSNSFVKEQNFDNALGYILMWKWLSNEIWRRKLKINMYSYLCMCVSLRKKWLYMIAYVSQEDVCIQVFFYS